jgi:ABC-2 type transport system ATP-binding protein
VAIVDHGQVIAEGTVDELKRSMHRDHVTHIEGVIPNAARLAVEALPQVSKVGVSSANGSTKLTVVTEDRHNALHRMIEALTQNGATVQQVSPEEVTLEDVFVAKTGRTLADDTRVV